MSQKNTYFTAAQIQSRLMLLAALFVLLLGVTLTVAPAVRERTWQVDFPLNHWAGVGIWTILAFLAHRHIRKKLPESDPYLLPLASILSGWGLVSIWRLTETFGLRQAAWIGISFSILILLLRHRELLSFLRSYKYIWLISGLLLTALTFILGANPMGNGPRLWLGCCGVYLQPSEPLKLLLVVYLASYFAGKTAFGARILPLVLPSLFMFGLALSILLAQKDLGTASIFVVLYALMVYLASAKRRILILSAASLIGLGLAGYFFIEVIQHRLTSWINPWQDPSGRSYQVIQSILAIANGGLPGRGIGLGSPGLVPVAHSDFIFAAIAEETGLAGSLALLSIIGIFVLRSFIIALKAENHFERLLASGLGIYIGIQSILIIGGNLRGLPLTGVTLPFVSYGGSSLLTSFLALLLLLQISNGTDKDPEPLPQTKPYIFVAGILGFGLTSLMLINGWWSIIRADDLLLRYDNPRRTIADRYVLRGSIVDRKNQTIVYTTGEPGQYQRIYVYPQLSATIGYTQSVYGQAGIEAELDPYLRGLQGYPAHQVWWQRLLYGTPPAGLDIRLSIDLSLQQKADELLGAEKGALVLLNAQTGEILAMASHPTFDANLLNELGEEILDSNDAPLMNRAEQGLYPPGATISPLLLAILFDSGLNVPDIPFTEPSCKNAPETSPEDWNSALSAGCDESVNALLERLDNEQKESFFQALSIEQMPGKISISDLNQTAQWTPLEMARIAAAISNQGNTPTTQIVQAINNPQEGWIILTNQAEHQVLFSESAANLTAQILLVPTSSYWESAGQVQLDSQSTGLYLAGTLPGWQGTPISVAVVVEDDSLNRAREIGRSLIETAIQP